MRSDVLDTQHKHSHKMSTIELDPVELGKTEQGAMIEVKWHVLIQLHRFQTYGPSKTSHNLQY